MKKLFVLVESVKGCQFANIEYFADCKFPKKSGLGNVTKVVSGVVQLNFDYCKAVKNRIAKCGGNPDAFVGESLPWGAWEIANKVITHKGKQYLRYYAVSGSKMNVTYYVDGVLATDAQVADIKAYLATKDTKSAKQSASGLDDNQVIPRCVEFANIRSLAVNGETYTNTAYKAVV